MRVRRVTGGPGSARYHADMITAAEEILAGTDWPALQHAYDSADDLPAHLTALLSGDHDQISDAVHALYWSVLHQGTIYSATAPAARYVAAILPGPVTTVAYLSPEDEQPRPLRAHLLSWLDDVADSALEFGDDDEEPDVAATRATFPELYQAVAACWDDPDPAVRVAACQAALTMLTADELSPARAAAVPHLTAEPELRPNPERHRLTQILDEWGLQP